MGDNLQGAVNGFLFCILTPKVNNHIKNWFYRCCKRIPAGEVVDQKSMMVNQNFLISQS